MPEVHDPTCTASSSLGLTWLRYWCMQHSRSCSRFSRKTCTPPCSRSEGVRPAARRATLHLKHQTRATRTAIASSAGKIASLSQKLWVIAATVCRRRASSSACAWASRIALRCQSKCACWCSSTSASCACSHASCSSSTLSSSLRSLLRCCLSCICASPVRQIRMSSRAQSRDGADAHLFKLEALDFDRSCLGVETRSLVGAIRTDVHEAPRHTRGAPWQIACQSCKCCCSSCCQDEKNRNAGKRTAQSRAQSAAVVSGCCCCCCSMCHRLVGS